ncbi:MAG: glycosyltransferase [Candidatus Kapabacteria bacterium]|jgi:glycosyltransferase involved in cell wall biosynthesis|nr:glycosyltransferase [Candidatus Kapabacteria bacterium]
MNQANKPLRVVHIATTDIGGGAAIASYRLHQGLVRLGVDSQMVVAQKMTDDPAVHGAQTLTKKLWARVAHQIDQIPRRFLTTTNASLLSPSWVWGDAIKRALSLKPDVVNLHWVQNGFVNPASLRLLQDIPTVWTLHDMWTFCGAEHYVGEDTRYIDGYTAQNRPSGESGFDLNRWTWKRKMRTIPALKRFTVVTDSSWLGECAAKSAMFRNEILRGKRVVPINYGLDTDVFKPIPKDVARYVLNIPQDKKVVLFGAINASGDMRKGIDLLASALQHYSQTTKTANIECYVFGASAPPKVSPTQTPLDFGFPVNYLGSMTDNIALAVLYSAADVMIVPSREEAFGQTALEALSCGTPAVVFRVGGLVDTIRHKENGYLAEPFQTEDLARGIGFVLEDAERYKTLSDNARKTALEGFTLEHQARRYMEVYAELLAR